MQAKSYMCFKTAVPFVPIPKEGADCPKSLANSIRMNPQFDCGPRNIVAIVEVSQQRSGKIRTSRRIMIQEWADSRANKAIQIADASLAKKHGI
jgi:hypothetical protein